MPDHVTRSTPTRGTQQPPVALATGVDLAARVDGLPVARPVRPVRRADEDGSLVSEYGLIAVLGATITGVAISWAKGGAIATLLDVILRQVQALVGA